jgi:hypothetical protein
LAPFTLAFIQRRGLRAAGIASGRVSTGEDRAARRAGNEVEETCDRSPAAALDLGQHQRGDQPADPATVDRQHPRRRAAY